RRSPASASRASTPTAPSFSAAGRTRIVSRAERTTPATAQGALSDARIATSESDGTRAVVREARAGGDRARRVRAHAGGTSTGRAADGWECIRDSFDQRDGEHGFV